MARRPGGIPFEPRSRRGRRESPAASTSGRAIPPEVAGRMARRVAVFTGLPTALGMAVFVVSYLLVSRGVVDIAPGLTLVLSGACFLLGLVGLSYGVLSASWDTGAPGSLLGGEQIGVNLRLLRQSIRASRASAPQGVAEGRGE